MVIIAAEEPPLLLTMHWIIGRIEIENNLPRRPLVRFQEQPDEQILDRRRIMRNLVITRRFRSAQLEPI